MLTQETLLAVILAAISLNLVLALAILVMNRRRRAAELSGRPRSDRTGIASVPRPVMPVFIEPPHGQHQTDPQTGLDVAATWERWLAEEDARTKRYRRSATIVLVEIEGIERLVERLGPAAADRLVPPVAATMRKYARSADRIARLGRSRFGALLPETDEVAAINYVERVRAAADLWLAAGAVALRLSVGWAETNGSRSTEDAIRAAEERLNGERRRAMGPDPAPAGDAVAEPAVG